MALRDGRPEAVVPVLGIETRDELRDPRPVGLGEPPRGNQAVVGVRLPGVEGDGAFEARGRLVEAPGLLEEPSEQGVSDAARSVERNQFAQLLLGFPGPMLSIQGFDLLRRPTVVVARRAKVRSYSATASVRIPFSHSRSPS